MKNIVKNDKRLFSLLQEGLSNDYIILDKSFIPTLQSNNLNRFLNKDNGFWFSRLKIKDGNSIYYFGHDDSTTNNVKPELILSCNEKSSIRFIKNKVAILTKLKNNNEDIIKSFSKYFSIRTNDKLKEKGLYFFMLGETSNEIHNNLQLFIQHVDYDLDYENNYLLITDNLQLNNDLQITEPQLTIDSHLEILKINLEILKIKKFIRNTTLNPKFIDSIFDYLFIIDENSDYNLNQTIFDSEIPFNESISIIYNLFKDYDEYLILDFEESLEYFKQNLLNEIEVYLDKIKKPNYIPDVDKIFSIDDTANIKEKIDYDTSSENIILNESKNTLYQKYLSLKDTPKIKFYLIPSLGVSREDLVNIYKDIKINIFYDNIVEENEEDIILEEYIRNYVSRNNSNELLKYFDEFISSEYYNELLKEYENFNKGDIEDIQNKIKIDIESGNLIESDIKFRFEKYFSKKSSELKYNQLLTFENENIIVYLKSGLKVEELHEIFNKINVKINNWHEDWTIFDIPLKNTINNMINDKQREIRTKSRQKFEDTFPNKTSIREVLEKVIFKPEEYDKLKDYIYQDIYNLKIRSENINNDLIITYYDLYLRSD